MNKMKKFVAGLAVIIILALAGRVNTTYSVRGVVTSNHNGIINIEDTTGNIWQYETELPEGTELEIFFDINETEDVREDDIITGLKVL